MSDHRSRWAAVWLVCAVLVSGATGAGPKLLLHLPLRDRHRDEQAANGEQLSPSFFSLLRRRKQMVCGGLAMIFGFALKRPLKVDF